MLNVEGFDHVWIKTLVLVSVHLLAPRMSHWLKNKDLFFNAFGGGMAMSYVFIHLLPEIGEGKEHLGIYTFIISLLGFALFSFMNQLLKRHENARLAEKHTYRLSLVEMWLYSFILIIGLPRDFGQSHVHIMLMTFAAVLHVIHSDYELNMEYTIPFKLNGRYVLASAPVLGLLVRWFLIAQTDILVHAITSVLAGSMIYSVAQKDLPTKNPFAILWFLLGILSYTGLLLLIEAQ